MAHDKQSVAHVILLNELTLWPLLMLVAKKCDIYIIDAPLTYPVLQPLFQRLTSFLTTRGWCRSIFDAGEDLRRFRELRIPIYHNDAFAVIEPWMNSHFRFDQSVTTLRLDDMPFRHVTCNFVAAWLRPVYLLHQILLTTGQRVRVLGADFTVQGLYNAQFGKLEAVTQAPSPRWYRTLNVITALGVACVLLLQICRSLRLRPPRATEVLLGCDFVDDRRYFDFWRDVAIEPAQLTVLFRSRSQAKIWRHRIGGYSSIVMGEGTLSLRDGLSNLRSGLVELRRIYKQAGGMPARLFVMAAALPVKRTLIRKLIGKFRFRFFWGRDDYNVEHILRSQELRKIGAKSLGYGHGLPTLAIIVPMYRYIDFDIYYVIGRHIHDYYRETWAQPMQVKPVGSMGMTRARQACLGKARPRDIIVAVKPNLFVAALNDALSVLARAFPDRTLYLQSAVGFSGSSVAKNFVAHLAAQHSNIQVSTETIYDLFLKAQYLVTDPSSVAAEAIQFGLVSFMLDIDGRKALYFRDFPGLCVSSSDEIVQRIGAIESGVSPYKRQTFVDLVDLSGQSMYDVVRADLGLAPHGAPDKQAA